MNEDVCLNCDDCTDAEGCPRRILVVDDNEDELYMLTRGLSSLGVQIDAVATCAEAVERMRTTHYDVAVVDLILTGDYWTGIEMCDYVEKAGTQAILVCSEPRLGRAFGSSRTVMQKAGRTADIVGLLRGMMPQVAPAGTPSIQMLRGSRQA